MSHSHRYLELNNSNSSHVSLDIPRVKPLTTQIKVFIYTTHYTPSPPSKQNRLNFYQQTDIYTCTSNTNQQVYVKQPTTIIIYIRKCVKCSIRERESYKYVYSEKLFISSQIRFDLNVIFVYSFMFWIVMMWLDMLNMFSISAIYGHQVRVGYAMSQHFIITTKIEWSSAI